MRVLLDECMPKKLRHELPGCDVKTVTQMGWSGTKNGALLKLASENFEVFLTVDQNLLHQQNTIRLGVAVIVLVAASNDIEVLRPLMKSVRSLIPSLEVGSVHIIK